MAKQSCLSPKSSRPQCSPNCRQACSSTRPGSTPGWPPEIGPKGGPPKDGSRLVTHWCRIPYDHIELLKGDSHIILAVLWPDRRFDPELVFSRWERGWSKTRKAGWWWLVHDNQFVARLRLTPTRNFQTRLGHDLWLETSVDQETTVGFWQHRGQMKRGLNQVRHQRNIQELADLGLI